MSASLVGSEMCIRDSHPGRPTIRASGGRRRHPPPCAGGALWGVWRGGGAVSYTHLTLPTICSV
eukprot:3170827-Alexandrium_andersonii.AAC.1